MLPLQILEVRKFYNLGDKTFETDFRKCSKFDPKNRDLSQISTQKVGPEQKIDQENVAPPQYDIY